jgi:hypothetical protein
MASRTRRCRRVPRENLHNLRLSAAVFSVGGDGRKTSHMLLYYAFVHVYSNGWSVGTNPSMSVDWEASRGNKLAFPVGLQVGKLRKLGPLPVKFDVQAQYYAVRPQNIWAEMESSAPNYADPPVFNRAQWTLKGSDMIITFLIAKIILGGYWLIFAPALFLPLGTILLSPQLLRGIFGYAVVLLSVAVAALGMIFLLTLTLPDAVTILAGLLAICCLAAAITRVARMKNKALAPLKNTQVLSDESGINF